MGQVATMTYTGPGEFDSWNFTTDGGLPFNSYVADGIPTPQPGQQLQVEYEQKTSKKGKQYFQVVAINGQRGQPRGNAGGNRYGGGGRGAPAYDPRTFVSNVVGQAISAKAITKPEELDAWALRAYKIIAGIGPAMAKEGVNQQAQTPANPAAPVPSPTPAAQPMDDDIPF